MTQFLETHVEGDTAACLSTANCARDAHRALGDAEEDLHGARSTAASSWRGDAGEAFYQGVTTASRYVADVAGKMQAINSALTDFAGELHVVKSKMANAREVAVASGLTVVGTQIQMPAAPSNDGQGHAAAYDRQVTGWNNAAAVVTDARRKETEAHGNLTLALDQAVGDGVIEKVLKFLGFLPPDAGPVHVGNWVFGLGGLGFGAGVSTMVTTRYGRFQPRINGRFASPAGLNFWERFKAGTTPSKSWHANANRAAIRDRKSVV